MQRCLFGRQLICHQIMLFIPALIETNVGICETCGYTEWCTSKLFVKYTLQPPHPLRLRLHYLLVYERERESQQHDPLLPKNVSCLVLTIPLILQLCINKPGIWSSLPSLGELDMTEPWHSTRPGQSESPGAECVMVIQGHANSHLHKLLRRHTTESACYPVYAV